MKRSFTYVLAIIVLIAMVFSCKKDDPAAAPSLVGTWKFSGETRTGCTDPSQNFNEPCTGDATACGKLVLTASTFTFTPPSGGGSPETGTYVTSGTTLTSTPTGGVADDPETFTVTATTLTLTRVDSSSGCTQTTTFTRI